MIDRVTVEYDQLHGSGQLENALDLRLDLGVAGGPRVRTLHQGALLRVVQYAAFGQRNVGGHTRDDHATLESVLQVVEQRFLHHVGHLVSFVEGEKGRLEFSKIPFFLDGYNSFSLHYN